MPERGQDSAAVDTRHVAAIETSSDSGLAKAARAKFWMAVLTDLRNRSIKDALEGGSPKVSVNRPGGVGDGPML
jgi:hypothetical protein